MVGSAVHGANTVGSRGKTIGDRSLEKTLTISIVVDALEEGKVLWIRRSGGSNVATEILNRDVAVADDVTALELLGSSVVCADGIGEGPSHEVAGLDLNVEAGVCCNVVSGTWEDNDGGDHVVV